MYCLFLCYSDKEGDDKGKKVKKKIPAWATISANKLASSSLSQPKVEEIILEAIEVWFRI